MSKPWVGSQYWESPVFMHWPVPYKALRPLVPEPFQLEIFNGHPWIGIVPFKALQTTPRWCSNIFSLGPLWQLNVRTYIRFFEEPAVYFLKVFTNSHLSILGASSMLSLPYKYAEFDTSGYKKEQSVSLNMNRDDAHFSSVIHPATDFFHPEANSLEYWLTERYHFYAIKGNYIYKASISHTPWSLCKAKHEMTTHHNLFNITPVTSNPLVHTAASKMTYLYPFEVKGKYVR